MQCWNCNAENEQGYAACWFCKEPPRPTEGAEGESPLPPPDDDTRSTRSVIHRAHTVERHTARSLEELPPEIRERIREMQADPAAGGMHSTYTYRGPDGHKRTFSSLDEMPPEVRAVFESGPSNLGPGARSSRRVVKTERVPRFDAVDVPTDDSSSGDQLGSTFALWAGGVLAAGLLVGLGLAGLITLPALGASDAVPCFLGLPLQGASRVIVGVGCLVIGGLLHVCLFWATPARRHRRFHGMRLFLTCVLAAFLLGNLHLLTTLLRAYRIE